MTAKAKVWCILTQDGLNRVMRPEDQQKLKDEFDVTFNKTQKMPDTAAIARKITGYDILLGGWGSPPLTEKVFAKADNLKMYAHFAGSVKHILSPEVVRDILVPRNIVTYSANEAIGYNVAESAVGLMMMVGHQWVPFVNDFRATGRWRADVAPWNGQFLQGSTVGIVAASKVGRHVMKLLSSWDLKMVCYDPYLSPAEAKKLGVRKVSLETLFKTADYITIHTPTTPETDGMITEKHFRLMKDGATLINTARPRVMDQDALYREAKTGRIYVCLDVTTPEPLNPDNPIGKLPNVYITPHISGAGFYGYFKIGENGLKAMKQRMAGKKVFGAVPYAVYDRLA
jgi:phosphoglycerate dehydrogenase-like enzyme